MEAPDIGIVPKASVSIVRWSPPGPAPSIRVPWRMNETRMFRASAEGLAAHVAAGMYNSHQAIFRRVSPVDRRGCTQLVIEGVKEEIGS